MKYWILFVVSLGIILIGCPADVAEKEDIDIQVCIPNTTQECLCPGSIPSSQVCFDDGSGWEDCVCLDVQDDTSNDVSSDIGADTSDDPETEESETEESDSDISESEEDSVGEPDTGDEEPELTCTDLDGDNHSGHGDGCDPESEDYDCNEERDDVYRGAEECSDGVDNDCDGEVDEELTDCCLYSEDDNPVRACYTGPEGTEDVGLCRGGEQGCIEGNVWGPCDQIIPSEEVCDGEDNDCDGVRDEEISCCAPGEFEECGTDVGLCEFGSRFCDQDRVWTECSGGTDPEDEICDGQDNDCDGDNDKTEDGEPLSEACYSGLDGTMGVGLCLGGTKFCTSGQWSTCDGEVLPIEESCSNPEADDDCNGTEDDIAGLGDSCDRTDTSGICVAGTRQCVENELVCVSNEESQPETCLNMGLDNDCNGEVDDVLGIDEICETDELGICRDGVRQCLEGELNCVVTSEPEEETCANPGADNDCNGIEDDIEGLGEECNTGEPGICSPGSWVCMDSDKVCAAAEEPGVEECDDVDSDCDGVVDELDADACGEGSVCVEPGICQCGGLEGQCRARDRCNSGLCCSGDRCSSPMVTIPSGVFMMGCNSSIDSCLLYEEPYHEVNVPEFEIDATEVTVGQYRVCVRDNGICSEPSAEGDLYSDWSNWQYSDRENHPVNFINWVQAKEYCEWAGKRLCSDSEWEKAARGIDGRIYPWGNEDPTCDRAVTCESNCQDVAGGRGCGEDKTWVVGSKPAGVYGLYDMSGNVWEFVEDDWHSNYIGAPADGSAWITGLDSRIKRGGSLHGPLAYLRVSDRHISDTEVADYDLGSRCCRTRCVDSSDCRRNEICNEGQCMRNPLACGSSGGVCREGDICQDGLCCSNDRCSSPMVIIPEGVFMMGCNSSVDSDCESDESPYHEVNVPDFEIDLTEVTVGEYRVCVEYNDQCSDPSINHDLCNWKYSDREEHPVNCISWIQAKAYCEWSGKRLCSESEWEKAARGTDERIYPWGNEEPTCEHTVMGSGDMYGCGENRTWPAGSKPTGVYGLYDMAGNVWEWVEDDYHSNYEGAPSDGSGWINNPRSGERVQRGGSFIYSSDLVRTSFRDFRSLNGVFVDIGTRCCRGTP